MSGDEFRSQVVRFLYSGVPDTMSSGEILRCQGTQVTHRR